MAGCEKTEWIWRDGEFVRWEDATIHVMSHVAHYGSSIFEGIRCYSTPNGTAIFRLEDHMRRFLDSGKVYRMEFDYSVEELSLIVEETVRRNNMPDGYKIGRASWSEGSELAAQRTASENGTT